MTPWARWRRVRSPGFTLVEVVCALAVTSILFVAMANALFIATKALPPADDPSAASVRSARVLDHIAAEIETAVGVSALSDRSIAFTVPDRDGDGVPERIAYSWAGKAGDPLERTVNGAASVAAAALNSFSIVANVRYVTEEYTSPGIEDAVPSALINLTTLLNAGSEKLGNDSRVNYGQYLAPAFGPDVIGWRPTSVQIAAQADKTPGAFRVQMREATATMLPRTTVLEDKLVNSSTLPALLMLPQTYTFSSVRRQAPGNGLCFTIMWASGAGPGRFQTSGANARFLSTNNAPTDWSLKSSDCLALVLNGVPMRMGSKVTASTRYLLSATISLGAGAGAGQVTQTTVQALNHPELLDGYWHLAFDADPTAVDVNGDGAPDWTASPGPSFDTAQLASGVWTAPSCALVTSPGCDFMNVTMVDLRMRALDPGAAAQFTINAVNDGDYCAPLAALLRLETDGTQTLIVQQRINASTWIPLITFAQLPAREIDLHLVIDPSCYGVGVTIDGVHKGTFPFTPVILPGTPRTASIGSTGGSAAFSLARIRVLGAQP
jgi:prepilin-type N-terminal cleavage/methylation domain-containing protein